MEKSSAQTFTKRVKDELVKNSYTFEEKKGILSSFLKSNGSISIIGKYSLRMQTSSANTSKFIYQLFKDIYKVNPSVTFTKQLRLKKNIIYHVEIDDKVELILKDLEVSEGLNNLSLSKMIDSKHFRGFLVGLVLACGQISDPKGKNYYCELSLLDEKMAKQVLSKLNHFKSDETMSFKLIKRQNRFVLYLKKSDQISVFLSYIGAQDMMFEFENSRLEKDYFNTENRLTICEQANYSRALKNGEENLKDIKILEEKCSSLPFNAKTIEIIKIRKENLDFSYQEIANKMCDKGEFISKSGVARIFKKLHEEASKFYIEDKID